MHPLRRQPLHPVRRYSPVKTSPRSSTEVSFPSAFVRLDIDAAGRERTRRPQARITCLALTLIERIFEQGREETR